MRTGITSACVMVLIVTLSVVFAQDTAEKPGSNAAGTVMKIQLASVFVDDQAKAMKFYTEVLGFVKKEDIPLGEFRWLTVVSSGAPEGSELLLEPNDNPAARTVQSAMFDQGIPAAMFFVEDVHGTTEKLKKLGVRFTMQPTDVGTTIIAVFDDTCGNLIQIAQG